MLEEEKKDDGNVVTCVDLDIALLGRSTTYTRPLHLKVIQLHVEPQRHLYQSWPYQRLYCQLISAVAATGPPAHGSE